MLVMVKRSTVRQTAPQSSPMTWSLHSSMAGHHSFIRGAFVDGVLQEAVVSLVQPIRSQFVGQETHRLGGSALGDRFYVDSCRSERPVLSVAEGSEESPPDCHEDSSLRST
jgi:hypothetical protein